MLTWGEVLECLHGAYTSKERKESFLEYVEHCGEEEGQREEDEQFISQLPAVVLGDEFPPQLNGPSHGFEFIVGLLDGPG